MKCYKKLTDYYDLYKLLLFYRYKIAELLQSDLYEILKESLLLELQISFSYYIHICSLMMKSKLP